MTRTLAQQYCTSNYVTDYTRGLCEFGGTELGILPNEQRVKQNRPKCPVRHVQSLHQGDVHAPKAGCSPNADSPKPPSPAAAGGDPPKADSPKPSTGAVSGTSGDAKGLLVAGCADRTAAAPQSALEPLRRVHQGLCMRWCSTGFYAAHMAFC